VGPACIAIRNFIVLWMVVAGVWVTTLSHVARAVTSVAPLDLEADRQMVTPISRNWQFCGGDDARWADPDFDASNWKILQPTAAWGTQGFAAVDLFPATRHTAPDCSQADVVEFG